MMIICHILLLVAYADAFFVARAAASFAMRRSDVIAQKRKVTTNIVAPFLGPRGDKHFATADASDDDEITPEEYVDVLRLLRLAWSSDAVPETSLPRAKLIRGGGGSFTLANPRFVRKGGNVPVANARFPELTRAVFALEEILRSDDNNTSSASCAVNCNAAFVPHVDSGIAASKSLSYIVGLGTYQGGDFVVEDQERDIRYAPLAFDGWRQQHWTQPFTGERFSLVWFTAASKKQAKVDRAAVLAAQEHSKVVKAAAIANNFDLAYRPSSTDVQAILEVLGDEPCYLHDDSWSPQGHDVVDAGAHIGCFSRYALDAGALSVRSFEPEQSNAALARRNAPQAHLVEAALVNSNTTTSATLVLGRQRNDGATNTWRHALEDYNTYAGDLETRTVSCLSFYDILGNATFVKMDIEGAELAILDNFEPGAWHNVRRLVFEYSFTKRRCMSAFRRIVQALEQEGFKLSYDFKGTLDELETWPGRTDALVFCSKD